MAKLLNEVREENKQSVKKQEDFEKTDNKKQIANKSSEPIIIKSNNENRESKNTGSKPSISAFSQVATSSSALLVTVQINQVLFSKLNLELQIGSLSIFK